MQNESVYEGPLPKGTHAVALSREQMLEIKGQLTDMLADPRLETCLVISTDIEETRDWFLEQALGFRSPILDTKVPDIHSVFIGSVFTLGYAAPPEKLVEIMDMEQN